MEPGNDTMEPGLGLILSPRQYFIHMNMSVLEQKKKLFKTVFFVIISLTLWMGFKLFRLQSIHHVEIIPLEDMDSQFINVTSQLLAQKFNFTIELKEKISLPQNVFDETRQQINAEKFLLELNPSPPKKTIFIYVTSKDLFVPSLPFVLSSADYKSRGIITSTFRLQKQNSLGLSPDKKTNEAHPEEIPSPRASKELIGERIFKTLLRGIGFISGLDLFSNCAMKSTNEVESLDLKSTDYCATDALLLSFTGLLKN
ncbi:MAG: hypothetical protein K1X29_08930 [Bdellovibrionales bacterium]|nr:hypothetical protein [Bdellovibrionales bacterium]